MNAHDDLDRVVQMVSNTRAGKVDGVGEGHNAALALDALRRVRIELDDRIQCLQAAVLFLEPYRDAGAIGVLLARCARIGAVAPKVPDGRLW